MSANWIRSKNWIDKCIGMDGWMDPKSIWCHTGVFFFLRLNVCLVANLSFYHTM